MPHLLAAGGMALIGTSVVASSLLSHYPHAGGQALRYGLAAAILLPLAGRHGPRVAVTAGDLVRLALLAATGMVGFNLAVLAALRTAEPAVPGVFIAASPMVFALVAAVRGRSAGGGWRSVVAAALVVAGAAVVQGFGDSDLTGLGWSLLALVGEVSFSAQAAPLLPRLGPVRVAGYGCALAAVEALVAGVALDGAEVLRVPTVAEAGGLLWLAVPVTVLAFLAWYVALGRLAVARATLYTGLIPLVAAALAPLLGTGRLGPGQLTGAALVAIGLFVGMGGSGVLARFRVRRPAMLPAARYEVTSAGERANRWR
jgi:drug/metabolite transporter (DMT)-like permease